MLTPSACHLAPRLVTVQAAQPSGGSWRRSSSTDSVHGDQPCSLLARTDSLDGARGSMVGPDGTRTWQNAARLRSDAIGTLSGTAIVEEEEPVLLQVRSLGGRSDEDEWVPERAQLNPGLSASAVSSCLPPPLAVPQYCHMQHVHYSPFGSSRCLSHLYDISWGWSHSAEISVYLYTNAQRCILRTYYILI